MPSPPPLGLSDRGALAWNAEGTTPDGRTVRMHGSNLVAVRDGRVSRFRGYWLLAPEA